MRRAGFPFEQREGGATLARSRSTPMVGQGKEKGQTMKRALLLVAVGVTFLLTLAGCGAMGGSEQANSPSDHSSSTHSPKSGESATPVTATPLSRGTLGEVKAE